MNNSNNDEKRSIIILVIALFTLAWTSMKLSLPALPTLIYAFHTTASRTKLAVSLFFASYAASQLFWGALSEKYGRKPIILAGMILSVLGTTLIIFSFDITSFILGRCVEQG